MFVAILFSLGCWKEKAKKILYKRFKYVKMFGQGFKALFVLLDTAGDDMFTNSMYGISLLDRLLLPAESIEMKSNEAYGVYIHNPVCFTQSVSSLGHLVHETAIENTYEQVTLPNKAKLDSASFPSQQRDHSQYDYITNNSVFHSE